MKRKKAALASKVALEGMHLKKIKRKEESEDEIEEKANMEFPPQHGSKDGL